MTAQAVSLFSGIGGLDLAATALGIDVRVSTDIDGEALTVLHRALGMRTVEGDISGLLRSGELTAQWPGAKRPDIVFGGPPCTPFSHAGFWLDEKRNGGDPASSLLDRFADAVECLLPRAFLLENVPGLAFKTHRLTLESFKNRMAGAGYLLSAQVLAASAFGVPQHRRRLFIAGATRNRAVRLDSWPQFPTRSAGEALCGLVAAQEPDERVAGEYGELLKEIPPGGNYLHFTDRYGRNPPRFKNRGRYWSFLLKTDPSKPSPTIPAQRVTYNGPFHWESRHLRIREIARIQGFPDSYPLTATLSEARRHLGNAVPPALGMAVLWRVLVALELADDAAIPPELQSWADASAPYESVLDDLTARSSVA